MLPAGIRHATFFSAMAAFAAILPILLLGLLGLAANPVQAAADTAAMTKDPFAALDSAAEAPPDSAEMARAHAQMDSIARSFKYRTGEIKLGDDLAVARLPDGYRYLDPEQTATVLTGLWGNPPGGTTLGMIFPPGQVPTDGDCWAVILSFDEDGYVKDDDAEKIDYDELLKDIQKSTRETNKEREKMDYEPIEIVGWAEKPSYDKAANKLYWAKEIKFGTSEINTLNYNIRVLGRRGVLVLNAVASMPALAQVKEGMKSLQPVVDFNEGHRYAEFDPKLDKVATYGIAGLVAGTLLVKGGLLKILIAALIAGKKFLIIGVLGVGAIISRFFKKPAEQKEIKEESRKV